MEKRFVFSEKEVQTLTESGLTPRQARLFLVLAKHKGSTAGAAASPSNLARQDVYKVLAELQQLGLVEKKIGNPTKFAAVPIQDACTELLNQRVTKTVALRAKMKTLTRSIERLNFLAVDDQDPRLLIIPKGEPFVRRIRKSIDNAQENIDFISSRKASGLGLFLLTESLKNAMHRGVKIRFITNTLEETDSQSAIPPVFMNNALFKIRVIPNRDSIRFCIYDRQEISVILSSKDYFTKSPLLWSDCASLVEIFKDYYEMMWLAATDLP